jgi:hypothetical protein
MSDPSDTDPDTQPEKNVEVETGPVEGPAPEQGEPRPAARPTARFRQIPQGTVALVTFDNHFVGPDGEMYKAAWGPCYYIPAKTALGFDPRLAANWFLQVGDNDACVFVAGCQVHYAVPLTIRPRGKFIYVPADYPTAGPLPD